MSEAESGGAPSQQPRIATIAAGDVLVALAAGARDMLATPALSLSFGLAYAAFGWLILYLMIAMNWGVYAYPLATGFALVAPMAAAGLYDISRMLEKGEKPTPASVRRCVIGHNGQSVRIMAVVTTFAYLIWLDIAVALYAVFFGLKPLRFSALIEAVLTTPQGFLFFALGNMLGAAIALAVFSIMVVSLPLIFDRDVDFVTSMIVSVKAVLANPVPMLLWCVIIGALLAISLASAFTGLIVVFPLLGHATWHVYRKVVLPA